MRTLLADARVVLRWSIRVWRTAPWLVAWFATASIASSALLVTFPWLWQYAVDAIHDGGDPVRLAELAGWMFAVGLGHAVLFTALQGSRAYGNALVSAYARRAVLQTLADADPDALRPWRAGDLVSRLHDDAGDKIGWFLCSGVFRAWEAALVASACGALMLGTAPSLAVWVVFPLPFLVAVQGPIQRLLSERHRAVQVAIAATSDQVTTTFSSIRVVQACDMVPAATARFDAAATAERHAEVRAAVVQSGLQLLYQYGWQLAVGALLLFGGLQVIEGRLDLGLYVTFEGLLAAMVWPMFDLGNLVSRVPQAAVALRRLDEVLEVPAGVLRPIDVDRDAALRLRAVGVQVADGAELLRDVDLEIGGGERVAVVGEVGAGKSVLVEVVSGLRSCTGEVQLGGELATVPQEASILTGSVRENITLGRDVSAEALDRAVAVSQLDRDLDRLADGLDTRMGERGITLSGGQRQRVAIARALVGDPGLLVLDDATSALDAAVEARFWEALAARVSGIGVLLVTHRVGTLAQVDRIVVLERGRVVQQGVHADLIAAEGAYRRIYGRLEALDELG